METLHTEPSRDQFKTESPIRAFTDWSTQGSYALGKGFRPSLAHVVPYMDAMEAKEGWRLVQILEAGTQTPSFVFRREREIDVDTVIDRLANGSDQGFRQRVKDWLLSGTTAPPPLMVNTMESVDAWLREPGFTLAATMDERSPMSVLYTVRKIATGLRQIAAESVAIDGGTHSDRLNGYAAELEAELEIAAPYVRNKAGFEEAGAKLDAARAASTAKDVMEAGYTASNQPDFGAPHDVPLLVLDDNEHESSAVYQAGRWMHITRMTDEENYSTHPMAALPLKWRERPGHDWTVCDIYKMLADAVTEASDEIADPYVTVERTMVGGHLAFKIKRDTESTPYQRANWTADPLLLKGLMRSMLPEEKRKFLKRHNRHSLIGFWRRATVADVLRVIDTLDWWDRLTLADPITLRELSLVLGRKLHATDPALQACNTDVEKVMRDFYKGQSLGETYQPEVTSDEEDPDNPDQRPAVERLIDQEERADDPLNPKHYHGRECADIGELLTGNSYQILKYNWRLGEKDSPCVELGKALWYLDSELAMTPQAALVPRALPEYGWFDEKLRHATPHAKGVARILISWNRYGNRHSLKGLRKLLQAQLDGLNGCTDWGRGLEP